MIEEGERVDREIIVSLTDRIQVAVGALPSLSCTVISSDAVYMAMVKGAVRAPARAGSIRQADRISSIISRWWQQWIRAASSHCGAVRTPHMGCGSPRSVGAPLCNASAAD